MPQDFTSRVLKLTLDLTTQNHKGSSSHHPQLACLVWKCLGKHCSLYRAPRFYTQCQSWPWTLTTNPKSLGFLLFYMWSLKMIGLRLLSMLCPQGLYVECQSWPWITRTKLNSVPLLIMHNINVKFESDPIEIVVCIVHTR